jgi:hypothetical protein
MKFQLFASLLNIAAIQAVALPAASPDSNGSGPMDIGVPKMVTPKYRSTAKRAIIRYPAFTLAAKGVSRIYQIKQMTEKDRVEVVSLWIPVVKVA